MGFVRFHPDIQLGNGNFNPGVLKTVLTVTGIQHRKVMLGAKELLTGTRASYWVSFKRCSVSQFAGCDSSDCCSTRSRSSVNNASSIGSGR